MSDQTGDVERLTQGTLTDGDVPDNYPDSPLEGDSNLSVFGTTVTVAEPEHRDTNFKLHPEGVPKRGTPSFDFFYGRPVLYL